MTQAMDFDVVVLGGGSAGFAAARTALAAGLKVSVVEGGPELGGLCILRGCMPTKTLLQAAEVRHLARHAGTWGIRVPRADFDCHPQVAAVGLTEKEARADARDFRTASYPFADHGKSVILGATDGFVKLLADARTGEIIGAGIAGPLGGELIHEIVAAMHGRMTVHQLAALPHYHPTLAEIWTYPAEQLANTTGDNRA